MRTLRILALSAAMSYILLIGLLGDRWQDVIRPPAAHRVTGAVYTRNRVGGGVLPENHQTVVRPMPPLKGPPSVSPSDATGFVCETTKGEFEVEFHPKLAPRSVARIKRVIQLQYFDQRIPFFRVNSWITQFGVSWLGRKPDPFAELRRPWTQDVHPYGPGNSPADAQERKRHPWKLGTFALIGGNHFLIVRRPNPQMGTNPQDAPCGTVIRGLDEVIQKLDNSYGNAVDNQRGPDQTLLAQQGNAYIDRLYPKTDYIEKCWLVKR